MYINLFLWKPKAGRLSYKTLPIFWLLKNSAEEIRTWGFVFYLTNLNISLILQLTSVFQNWFDPIYVMSVLFLWRYLIRVLLHFSVWFNVDLTLQFFLSSWRYCINKWCVSPNFSYLGLKFYFISSHKEICFISSPPKKQWKVWKWPVLDNCRLFNNDIVICSRKFLVLENDILLCIVNCINQPYRSISNSHSATSPKSVTAIANGIISYSWRPWMY